MAKFIVIVDDEKDIVSLVTINLEKSGFDAKGFTDVKPFWEFLKKKKPDLIILDLMLPESDGFDICKKLKADIRLKDIPIIMLTARGDEIDKVLGLELGADDYVTKPFSVKELIARVKNITKRYEISSENVEIIDEDFVLDNDRHEVILKGKKIDLTTSEFKILQLLASKKGHVLSRDRILEHLWGDDKIVIDRTVDFHVKNLREKLGKYGKLVKNIRGVGYKLEV
ncbi:MAG: response regulator transcription factor [Elusimicrobiota bacterium]